MKIINYKLIEEILKQGYRNICFMLPAKNIGGGTKKFCELAILLSQCNQLKIYYMDYKNGYPSYLLKDSDVEIIEYKDTDIFFPLKECIVVTNSTRMILLKQMDKNNKVFFWHYETTPCGWSTLMLNNETNKFMKLVDDNNAMSFLDWASKDSLNRYPPFKIFKKLNYWYVTVDPKKNHSNFKIINKDEINICWLSRLNIDKITALLNLIEIFAHYSTDKKKRLHIIGDGVSRKTVEEFCSKYQKYIEFVFTGSLTLDDANFYMVKNADIVFGMGASILESAALKIPSVILFASHNRYTDNEALWLKDSREKCIALTIEQKKDFNANYTSIIDIINSVYNEPSGKLKYGLLCYRYYKENHCDLNKLANNVLLFLKNSTLTFDKISKCLKFIPYCLIEIERKKILNKTFFLKIKHLNGIRYRFLGATFFRVKNSGSQITYFLFGINIFSKEVKKCFRFPVALRDESHIYKKEKK
ncbi:glycosyltransferase family 4 protein [Campylobacter lari]|nr:glycosyltransferase family 4 protein [Campylobacter lari]ECP5263917.1 glycosyltransferase family 4 protein [Campylobacter lari]